MTERSIKITEAQKKVLKGAFKRMPYPDHYEGALNLVSKRTGLQEELIKRWFARRREALGAEKKNHYNEEEIQILDGEQVGTDSVQDDSSDLDEDVELDGEDNIRIDEAPDEDVCVPPPIMARLSCEKGAVEALTPAKKLTSWSA